MPAALACTRAESRTLVLHWRAFVLPVPRAQLASVAHLVRRVVYRVFACERVQLALHHEVEEEARGRVVRHVAVKVDSPEERVALGRGRIREGHQVEGHVADHALIVEDLADGVANRLHVHIGQALLREEAA